MKKSEKRTKRNEKETRKREKTRRNEEPAGAHWVTNLAAARLMYLSPHLGHLPTCSTTLKELRLDAMRINKPSRGMFDDRQIAESRRAGIHGSIPARRGSAAAAATA